jgi:hypothetical protein
MTKEEEREVNFIRFGRYMTNEEMRKRDLFFIKYWGWVVIGIGLLLCLVKYFNW